MLNSTALRRLSEKGLIGGRADCAQWDQFVGTTCLVSHPGRPEVEGISVVPSVVGIHHGDTESTEISQDDSFAFRRSFIAFVGLLISDPSSFVFFDRRSQIRLRRAR